MNRTSEHILRDIDKYIKVRDYMVNTPMYNYDLHMVAIDLILDKLYELQAEYNHAMDNNNAFRWNEYQFVNS